MAWAQKEWEKNLHLQALNISNSLLNLTFVGVATIIKCFIFVGVVITYKTCPLLLIACRAI